MNTARLSWLCLVLAACWLPDGRCPPGSELTDDGGCVPASADAAVHVQPHGPADETGNTSDAGAAGALDFPHSVEKAARPAVGCNHPAAPASLEQLR